MLLHNFVFQYYMKNLMRHYIQQKNMNHIRYIRKEYLLNTTLLFYKMYQKIIYCSYNLVLTYQYQICLLLCYLLYLLWLRHNCLPRLTKFHS